MADDQLLDAAARIADGDVIDWVSVTATLRSDEDRAIAEGLAIVQQIAVGHRQLHQLLPVATDTPPHLMPDRARWGHLDLLNVVGRGSYGMVYRAWDTRLERLVALKLFHGASNPDAVMQEGRMLARVRHENVVTVYGADVIDGVAGIWMELVHGETLDRIVRKGGALPPREAAAIGADVARALGAVHAAALLHCDVKAQNVVREESGRVVLMDLGAGRLVPEARDLDQPVSDVAGTPRYMAPELLIAGGIATREADIYSLGVLIYYLVSGQYPVDGRTLGELKRAHEAMRTRPLTEARRGLPTRLTEIVSRALERDPALRPSSVADIQTALSAAAIEPGEPAVTRLQPWWIVAGAALAVLTVVLIRPLLTPTVPAPPMPSLAVLPIQNLTGDPSKQYLADGLTELLVAHLARVSGLQVASSATMATLQGSLTDELAMAEKLGVRLLLAGSVLQADNRIALSVKLNDPREGRTIWGTEIERQPATILSARTEIASLVAARLSLVAPPSDTRAQRSLNAEAQDLFLRGLVELAPESNDRTLRAIDLLTRAVAAEPLWADPVAYLALAQQRAIETGNPAERGARADLVRTTALRAIQLDPSLPASYTALAAVQAYHDWDFRAAESTLRQGLASAGAKGTAHGRLALVLAAEGRTAEAVTESEAARDLEPLVPERHSTLAIVRYYARDFDRAAADAERSLVIAPDFALGHHALGRIRAAQGRYDEAIDSLRRAVAIAEHPGWLMSLAIVSAQAGRTTDVDRVLRRLRELESDGAFVSIDNFAYIAAYQGRRDAAFRLLNEAIDRRMTNVLWLAVDPRADTLRNDPRFDALVSRMGLVSR